jgi:NAD-dependent SIR2 family protein deacetylase
LQIELERRNPGFAPLDAIEAPDGDADLEGIAFDAFDVPACHACGGLLKPDVVFFGENVPAERVQRAMAPIAHADAMLVVGSSLMIYSGYRFVTAAADSGKPIAAVNLGRTRADEILTLKIEDRCANALRVLAC